MVRRVRKKKCEEKMQKEIMKAYKDGFTIEDHPTKDGGDIVTFRPLKKKKNKRRD